MNDFRCRKCNKLLCRYRECLELEIKCPRCSTVNSLSSQAYTVRAKTGQDDRTAIPVRSDTNAG